MNQHFIGSKNFQQQICQALVELKKNGRAIEHTAETLLPLAQNGRVSDVLESVVKHGRMIAEETRVLYNEIAREAFSE